MNTLEYDIAAAKNQIGIDNPNLFKKKFAGILHVALDTGMVCLRATSDLLHIGKIDLSKKRVSLFLDLGISPLNLLVFQKSMQDSIDSEYTSTSCRYSLRKNELCTGKGAPLILHY
ncbi:hypothetical protein ABER23_14135 [Paenibacillus lautus]|uniref:hypothetical protein n=1 Tax=Paenibacillus lautus TaxID=1401 RepID=UPI003D2E1B6D